MWDASDDATPFELTSCHIVRTISNDADLAAPVIMCTTVAGVGGGYKAVINVQTPYTLANGNANTKTCTTSFSGVSNSPEFAYSTPIISGVAVPGTTIPTAGQADGVTITGTNFGPSGGGNVVRAIYENANGDGPYITAPCEFVTAHTVVKCDTIVGVGGAHSWKIQVGSLVSPGERAERGGGGVEEDEYASHH